jgi:hypothetical protein
LFSVDLPGGTRTYVLTVTGHAARRIRILGVTAVPHRGMTAQQARNLIMDPGEQAEHVKFMIATAARTSPPRSTRSSPMPGSGPCRAAYGHPA